MKIKPTESFTVKRNYGKHYPNFDPVIVPLYRFKRLHNINNSK